MTPFRLTVAVVLLLSTVGVGCSDSTPAAHGMDAAVTDGSAPPSDSGLFTDAQNPTDASDVPPGSAADCDPLDPAECAFPWPSNLYLQPDTTRRTGYTLSFGATTLPANISGSNMRPDPFRALDGYSVGTPIITVFPNLDVRALATEDHMDRSMDPMASVLLFEVNGTTLQRLPYWVELDAHATDPAHAALFVRPGVILHEATRYIVAFRNLHDTSGAVVPPSAAFASLVAGTTAGDPHLAPRQSHFNDVFTTLDGQGIPRASLTLAWDFVTASDDAVHGRMLAIRDDVLSRVGPNGPTLVVDTVTQYTPTMDTSGRPVDPDIAMEVQGHFDAPWYMHATTHGPFTGDVMNLDAAGHPFAMGTHTVPFWVRIPYAALNGPPQGLVQYGHGLLGSGSEVESGYIGHIANANNLIFFAGDLTGMSTLDVLGVVGTLHDFDDFSWIADNLHQGMAEWLILARAVRSQLTSLPQVAAQHVMVDPTQIYYSGNSQGGIFGATYVALSQDITRGHLGVPGSNYSTLLQRSKDFTNYFSVVRMAYPSVLDQDVLLPAIQLLWDSTDPVTYYRHLSQLPFANTPSHQVVLTPARGDYQVAVVTNEVVARSNLGVSLMANYDDLRTPYGITQTPYPSNGSGVVLWHFGNPWPPLGNVAPMDPPGDPHELPRRDPEEQHQMVNFFRTGQILSVCNEHPCPSP